MGGYFFISTMVYNTMIRIKAMYSIVSTPSRKKGQKASPLQNQKGENRQPYGNACLYSTRSFQWAQHQNRKAAGFPAAFCVERRRFEEDISNPCRRHTETILYSLFTIHFFTRSCARVKNQGIPLSSGDRQGTAPRKGGYHSKAGRVPGREGFSR